MKMFENRRQMVTTIIVLLCIVLLAGAIGFGRTVLPFILRNL